MREETKEIEVEIEVGDSKFLYSNKVVEASKKHLTKKGFVEEIGFKKLVAPFKEKIEQRGWETVSKHMKLGKRALVKEFYTNLSDRKNMTCYVRGRWVPFGERALSQLLGLKTVRDCTVYEQL